MEVNFRFGRGEKRQSEREKAKELKKWAMLGGAGAVALYFGSSIVGYVVSTTVGLVASPLVIVPAGYIAYKNRDAIADKLKGFIGR